MRSREGLSPGGRRGEGGDSVQATWPGGGVPGPGCQARRRGQRGSQLRGRGRWKRVLEPSGGFVRPPSIPMAGLAARRCPESELVWGPGPPRDGEWPRHRLVRGDVPRPNGEAAVTHVWVRGRCLDTRSTRPVGVPPLRPLGPAWPRCGLPAPRPLWGPDPGTSPARLPTRRSWRPAAGSRGPALLRPPARLLPGPRAPSARTPILCPPRGAGYLGPRHRVPPQARGWAQPGVTLGTLRQDRLLRPRGSGPPACEREVGLGPRSGHLPRAGRAGGGRSLALSLIVVFPSLPFLLYIS